MQYRRFYQPGGRFFFTVVTYNRQRILTSQNGLKILRRAVRETKQSHPFDVDAIVIMPDHFHLIMKLPQNDIHYSKRIGLIKSKFTKQWRLDNLPEQTVTQGQSRKRCGGVWQTRFWEHCIRDSKDFTLHMEYIHMNPVKHGLAECANDWPWSSFKKYVEQGLYDTSWQGQMDLPGNIEYSITL